MTLTGKSMFLAKKGASLNSEEITKLRKMPPEEDKDDEPYQDWHSLVEDKDIE